jgi:hypothetical protein
VNVDETGREYLAFGVDRLRCACGSNAADAHDASAFDCHIRTEPRIAAAVDDSPAANDEIVRLRGQRRGRQTNDRDRDCGKAGG